MKITQDLILIGAAGVAAYFIFGKSFKNISSTTANITGAAANVSGNVSGALTNVSQDVSNVATHTGDFFSNLIIGIEDFPGKVETWLKDEYSHLISHF